MDSYLKKDTYSHQRAAFYKRLHQKGISSKLLSYIDSFVQTQNTQVYNRSRILVIYYYNIDDWNQAYVPTMRIFFFFTELNSNKNPSICTHYGNQQQSVPKYEKKSGTSFVFKYWQGSIYQLGKGEKKKRGKKKKRKGEKK